MTDMTPIPWKFLLLYGTLLSNPLVAKQFNDDEDLLIDPCDLVPLRSPRSRPMPK
jgi:hypothetical protein